MARGSDPDSRPISVAELMARAKQQGADDVAAAVENSSASTGRRRRGGKDSVSVAELTGEIPRVTARQQADSPSTSRKEARATQPEVGTPSPSAARPISTPVSRAPAAATPPPMLPPTRDFSSSEVSKRAAAEVDSAVKPTPGAPDRPAPLRPRPETAGSGTDRTPRSDSRSDFADARAATTSAQGAVGQDSVGTRSTPGESDEETTSVILSMQAYSQVDDNGDDDHRVLSAAEREREFERYRNFEDVETDEDAHTAPSGGKKKRGLFGFGRKNATEAASDGGDLDDHSDRSVTQFIPKPADESEKSGSVFAATAAAPVPERKRASAAEQMSRQRKSVAAGDPAGDRYLRFDANTDNTDNDVDTAKSAEVPDESPTSEFGRFHAAAAGKTPGTGSDRDDAEVKTEKTSLVKGGTGPSGPGHDAAAATSGTTRSGAATSDTSGEQSPTVQWLLLIGQVLAGLVVGVALFWGFTELWRWNVMFALILSVAVIFGLVTLVHVVRRSSDLISTLLALGVGLLVTIGPLVLLLIAGD